MAEPAHERRWWQAIPLTVPGSNVATHPNATLDAQAARLMNVRQAVLQLDMEIQRTDGMFKSTLAEIETHYHKQVDEVEHQYRTKSADLASRYREAHAALLREQKAMADALKGVDCRAEFVNHFPAPTPAVPAANDDPRGPSP